MSVEIKFQHSQHCVL